MTERGHFGFVAFVAESPSRISCFLDHVSCLLRNVSCVLCRGMAYNGAGSIVAEQVDMRGVWGSLGPAAAGSENWGHAPVKVRASPENDGCLCEA